MRQRELAQLPLVTVGRDVKLENALLDGTHTLLKITDFGYAKTSADSNCLSLVGTPGYAGALPLMLCCHLRACAFACGRMRGIMQAPAALMSIPRRTERQCTQQVHDQLQPDLRVNLRCKLTPLLNQLTFILLALLSHSHSLIST